MRALHLSRTTFIMGVIVGITAAAAIPLAVGAGADQPTYALSKFAIEHPYDDPRDEILPSAELAAVSFVAHWPEEGFPGTADCELSLLASDESPVGTLTFDLVVGVDGAQPPPMVLPVSAPPSTAEASCTDRAGEAAVGAGYQFVGPTKVAAAINPLTESTIKNITEVEFDVRWVGESSPGLRTCYLTVLRSDGTSDAPVKHGVLWGEGPLTFDVEGAPATVSGAEVTCGPFEG
jgi:hypothetical protein